MSGGKLSMLIQGLDGPMLKGSEEFTDRRKSIVNYFLRTNKTHNLYALKFVFCEFLNIVNILFQVRVLSATFRHCCLVRNEHLYGQPFF